MNVGPGARFVLECEAACLKASEALQEAPGSCRVTTLDQNQTCRHNCSSSKKQSQTSLHLGSSVSASKVVRVRHKSIQARCVLHMDWQTNVFDHAMDSTYGPVRPGAAGCVLLHHKLIAASCLHAD